MKTCAKVNLYLKVVRKRPDGYHELENLFWPLPWLADEVTVEPCANGIVLECDTAGIPCDRRNLCWRAVEAFAAA
ncbi:MAG: 4-(cytidine 5'-diphospho)-2-C-methyl-D-erythritol kinase, partial [Victivallales bacterium]|nr:4-(cytidine 5'-diphospho)-2-C-methyl-D-erythritol kinase [Victivallales bacterium]